MFKSRLVVARLIFLAVIGLVVVRLFYWQIIMGDQLSTRAFSQYNSITTLPGNRGNIYASDGSILTGSQTSYLLYAYKPQLEIDTASLTEKLLPILMDTPIITTSSAETLPTPEELKKDYLDLLNSQLNRQSSWVALKHHLNESQRNRIEELNIVGLGFQDEITRFYPEASLSAQLLGFVGQDASGESQGYFGLEGYYDRQLQGRSGKIRQEKDAQGDPILTADFSFFRSQTGRHLYTRINRSLQYQIEALLRRGLDRYGAVQGTATLMDTKTGDILAMASVPSYDPRIFYKFEQSLYKNPVVADLFEPGSIFKPIIMAAAVDAGVVKSNTKCDICGSPIVIGEFTIKTWNEEYHPDTTMTETIVNSDNTGMVFAARKLEKENLITYLQKFNFDSPTGIDLQEETFAKLRESNQIREVDMATISFGQGIAVTRIQVLAAVNAIANRGKWVQPRVVTSIDDGRKKMPNTTPTPHQVVSAESAAEITAMMVAAVKDGEAKWAAPKNVTIAGKTGTAQIPVEGHYDEEKTIASFVGFFPAEDPQYTMLVTLREPTSSPWGSETAAPLWFDIANQVLLARP